VDAWEEEQGLSEDLIGRNSGQRSDGCGHVTRSGGGCDLRSDESEFLRKTNTNEGREWMQRQIMRLLTPFIGRRREGIRYSGGETVDDEWSYSMLPF
jgi:hypothetical protein